MLVNKGKKCIIVEVVMFFVRRNLFGLRVVSWLEMLEVQICYTF